MILKQRSSFKVDCRMYILLTNSKIDYRFTLWRWLCNWHQVSSATQSCLTLCVPMDCSMPGFPVHHQLPEPTQIHVHRVGNAIQLYHHLLSPSPPTFHLFQHQGLFQWGHSSNQVAKIVEFQLQYQSFQ